MKKIGIVALLLVLCLLGCCLASCSKTYKGKVPDNLLEQYGFGGLELIDNDDTQYTIHRTYISISTNIDSYEEYKAFCEYVYSYVTSVDGVVVAGSVESEWTTHTIVEEFRVHSGKGLDQGYNCFDAYAYTKEEVGEDGSLSGVFNINVNYNIDEDKNHGYNLCVMIYNSKSVGSWYYNG